MVWYKECFGEGVWWALNKSNDLMWQMRSINEFPTYAWLLIGKADTSRHILCHTSQCSPSIEGNVTKESCGEKILLIIYLNKNSGNGIRICMSELSCYLGAPWFWAHQLPSQASALGSAPLGEGVDGLLGPSINCHSVVWKFFLCLTTLHDIKLLKGISLLLIWIMKSRPIWLACDQQCVGPLSSYYQPFGICVCVGLILLTRLISPWEQNPWLLILLCSQ